MSSRLILTRVLPSLVFICVLLPNRASAQLISSHGTDAYGPGPNGAGHFNSYPTPPSTWNYPGLSGGPFVTPFVYPGSRPSLWNQGLFHHPPVPVYGSLPNLIGDSDLVNQWRTGPGIGGGIGYYGWFGAYRASPRPRPPSVNPWPTLDPIGVRPQPAVADTPDTSLRIFIKVQPAAEVFVDGVKTVQTGTDRVFESPPLEAGNQYAYEIVVRWVERGATVERKKTATGKAGEVIRLDLSGP